MTNKLLLTAFGCAFIASAQPSVISLLPLHGTGASGTFTSVYRHPGGKEKHYLAYLLILPTPNIVQFTAKGSCLIEYNRISNGVRLINNEANNWLGRPEGEPASPAGTTLTNNYCSVNTRNVTASHSGTDMTVTVPVTFNGTFTGPLTTFLQEDDVDDNWTGMTQFGTWTAYPIASPKPGPYPYMSNIHHPAYTVRGPAYVELVAGHNSGRTALWMTNILIASSIVGATNRCHIIYWHAADKFELLNEAGTAWLPTPAQNNTCVVGNGVRGDVLYTLKNTNEVRMHVPMDFNPAITTKLNVWANTFDNFGNLTHWLAPGQ
jgi:hypothetical protein